MVYCTRHNIDLFDSGVNQGTEFLEEYFHEGVSYSLVNAVRWALSSAFPVEYGTPYGKHPRIVRLLRGIFKQRPSLPHYTVTYDVVKMLQYISNSYSKTYLECLTKKLETLICILSGQKSQPMSLLNTNYMHIDENHCLLHSISFKNCKASFPPVPFGI